MATPSVSMWAASESSASEPATNAVTASTTTNITVSAKRDPEPADVAGRGAAQGVAVVVRRRGRGSWSGTAAFSPPVVAAVGTERP